MRKSLFVLLLTLGCAAWVSIHAAPPAKIFPDRELFRRCKGHIQGMCCSEDAIYLTQQERIWVFDWQGKLLKSAPSENHTGDICLWQGELYTAVAIHRGKGKIQVFDLDLKLLRETILTEEMDGITVCDGVLYAGIGEKREAHRGNRIQRFDPKTLKPLGPAQVVDTGYATQWGVQDMATDGKVLFLSFYPAVEGEPATFRCDKDLKIINEIPVSEFSASNGLDVIPEKISKSKDLWILRVWKFHLESWKCVNGRFPR